ncbi:MAG: Gfo/Idh/MocA family oxidoreductase [Verrucomicrobiota bacterium]
MMRTIRFGIIGCGLMGREFASAAARWCHLLKPAARPEIVAVCNRSPAPFDWFRQNFPGLGQFTHDYRELLANGEVEAVYMALPHHLHREVCCAAIAAGKHLMAEKPVGIDLAAHQAIHECAAQHPKVFVRGASQWLFFPAVQRIGEALERNLFGRILEVNAGFLHSSDLDPNKPINWKRMIEFNGEYGVMGDLGLHVCTVPFRAGWFPRNVRAVLSDIVQERPDGKGGRAPCRTWDNATLLCEATDPGSGQPFPMTLKFQRMAPGQKNTWYLEVLGAKASARFSTRQPKRLEWLDYSGGEQVWGCVETGHETAFQTITGPIFEFGFPDAILQMWAAFLHELVAGVPAKRFAGCPTLAEAALSHRLFTAALASQKNQTVENV